MLIFFDIDGTLIDEKKRKMPESAAEAIRQARENGHFCMINTGRTRCLVNEKVYGDTEFDGLLLGCGTMITCHGETIFHKTFSAEQAERIIGALKGYRIDAVLEGAQNNYICSPGDFFYPAFGAYLNRLDGYLKQIGADGYGSYEEAVGRFDKFYAYTEAREQMAAFERDFKEELDFIDRQGGFFEVMPKGCSKASAMEQAAACLGVPMDSTAAVGDSSNDIQMIECAGIGIAMGNATEQVKRAADYVTTEVDRDGIRNALRWLGCL